MGDHEGFAQQMKVLPKFLTVMSDTCLVIGVFVVSGAMMQCPASLEPTVHDATFTECTLCQRPWHLKQTRLGPDYRAELNSFFAGLMRDHSQILHVAAQASTACLNSV